MALRCQAEPTPPAGDERGRGGLPEPCADLPRRPHGGNSAVVPMLIGLGSRHVRRADHRRHPQGKGHMPPMPDVAGARIWKRCCAFWGRTDCRRPEPRGAAGCGADYIFTGYRKFLDPDGYPAIAPPWGTLNAIDLKTGQVSVEDSPRRIPRPCPAGNEEHRLGELRRPHCDCGRSAVHRRDGLRPQVPRLRQPHRQAAVGDRAAVCRRRHASTYMVDGRQYVVIAASGGRDPKSPVGGAYIRASALPRLSGPVREAGRINIIAFSSPFCAEFGYACLRNNGGCDDGHSKRTDC